MAADPAAPRESGSSGYIIKPTLLATLPRRPNAAPTSSLVLRQMAQYGWNSMGILTYGSNAPFGALLLARFVRHRLHRLLPQPNQLIPLSRRDHQQVALEWVCCWIAAES